MLSVLATRCGLREHSARSVRRGADLDGRARAAVLDAHAAPIGYTTRILDLTGFEERKWASGLALRASLTSPPKTRAAEHEAQHK